MIRREAEMPVSRFSSILGIPRRTYCRRQARARSGESAAVKGPWPSPSVDAVAAILAGYLSEHPDHGHRRIHALLIADGHATSPSTVLRAIQRVCGGAGGGG
jgi:putative transposase